MEGEPDKLEDDEAGDRDSNAVDEPAPGAGPAPTLPYASPRVAVNLKTVRRLPAFEANLAAGKLEAAGINSFIADQNIAAAHPLAFSQVRLQVAEADLERAEEILATPSVSTASADDEGEYVEEAYRCPKCHRKPVDLAPLSPAMRTTRFGCLLVALLPVLAALITWIIPHVTGDEPPELTYPPTLVLTWLVILGVLCFIVFTAKRTKRCRECGHEWSGEPAS
jgi:hypothetical protein